MFLLLSFPLGSPSPSLAKVGHGQNTAISREAALGYSLEHVAPLVYRAALIDNLKDCHSLTLCLKQEAAMLLLAISFVCIDAPAYLVAGGSTGAPEQPCLG